MSRKRIFKSLLVALTTTAVVASCTQNDEMPNNQESQVTLSATVASSQDPDATLSNLEYGYLNINEVTMSVDHLRLNLRATSETSNKPTIVNLNNPKPQVLSVVKDGQVQFPHIGDFSAYNGVYGSLDFSLVKAADVAEEDEMYGKSVLVKADWKGVPATMYIDLEDSFKVMFPQGIEVDGAKELILTLYLDKFFEGVDRTIISDGDGDGVIEVGPNGEDGNDETYASIVANIEGALFMKDGEFK